MKDFTTDPGLQLMHKISRSFVVPGYVADADQSDFETNENSVSKCAMISPEPRLPAHNRASTWYSYASFVTQKESSELEQVELDKIESYLKAAAESLGIIDDINAVDVTYAVSKVASEETTERLPVRGEAEAKVAAEAFAELSDTSVTERVELARKISAYGFDNEYIKRSTCHYGCYDGKAVASLLRRTENTYATKLAEMCEGLSPQEMQANHKMAAEICEAANVLGDRPEIELAVNTVDPVAFLSNGSVVKESQLTAANSNILVAAATGVVSLNDSKYVKAAQDMSADLADDLVADLTAQGISVEVNPGDGFDFTITTL